MENIHTKIVGVTFESRQALIKQLQPGQELQLVREPDNQYDSNAVAVKTMNDEHLGYIRKELAVDFAEAMDKGVKYQVQVADLTGETMGQSFGCNITISQKGPE